MPLSLIQAADDGWQESLDMRTKLCDAEEMVRELTSTFHLVHPLITIGESSLEQLSAVPRP